MPSNTASQLPRTAVFGPVAPAPTSVTVEVVAPDQDGDAQIILRCNGEPQYILYLSDRKGRKDPSNPGLRLNLRPIAPTAKGIRRQKVGARDYEYIEVNYLTPSGKSLRSAR